MLLKRKSSHASMFLVVLLQLSSVQAVFAADTADDEYSNCAVSNAVANSSSFNELSATLGETTLITTNILTAYSPWSKERGDFPSPPKGLGINITASIPAATAKQADYADSSLLLRHGGLINAYFSLVGSPSWFVSGCEDKLANVSGYTTNKWVRSFVPDRVYLARHPVPPLVRAYITHGLGIKAIKKGLVDDLNGTNNEGSDIGAAGVFYLGIGFDGPVWESDDTASAFGAAGTLDFQVFTSWMRINDGTLRELYSNTQIDDNVIKTAGAVLRLIVSNRISLDIEYAAPLDDAKEYMDETVAFSISYATE